VKHTKGAYVDMSKIHA